MTRRSDAEEVEVQQAVSDYLASSAVKRLYPATQQAYSYKLGLFADWCATQNHALHAVDSNTLEDYLQHFRLTHRPCKAGVTSISTQTLAAHVRAIKTFLNWCLLDEQYTQHVQALAVQRIRKPKLVETVLETFTPGQIAALFKACDREKSEHLQMRDRAILALLLDSGVRAQELVTLTIGNVHLDPKDAYVRILGKGGKWGEVGLGEQARRAIAKYLRVWREPTIDTQTKVAHSNLSDRQLAQMQRTYRDQSPLFMNREGKPMTRSGLLQLIKRLGEWADIRNVRCSPHTLRHTFSKLFMQNGGDIYKLSKLLRHSSVSVTEHYLKSLRQSEARQGVSSVLDELI